MSLPKMDYSTLYEVKTLKSMNPDTIEFTEPLKNLYETGSIRWMLPHTGHVIIVSKLLGTSLLEIYENVLQDDEKELVRKNNIYEVALHKLKKAAMSVEVMDDPYKVEECVRWQLCLDSLEEDAEYIANCASQHVVERYYRDVRLTQRSD